MQLTKEDIKIIKWNILQITLYLLYMDAILVGFYTICKINDALTRSIALAIFSFIFVGIPIFNMLTYNIFGWENG